MKRHIKRMGVLAATAGALVATAALGTSGAGAQTALTGNIAFTSNAPATGGHFRINVMNTDGVGKALNPNPTGGYDDVDPAWSADGTRIAFASNRDGNYNIYVMNINGTGVTRITTEPRDDRYPAWSPDGSRIAFRGYNAPTGGSQIILVDPSGANPATLAGSAGGDQPAWSPNGQQIAFTHTAAPPAGSVPGPGCPNTDDEIFVANVNGTGTPSNMTNSPSTSDRYPAWFPSGTEIAFRRCNNASAGRELYTINTTTKAITPLNGLNPGRAASWSPDARALTFVSYRDPDGDQEIWVGSRDGSTIRPRQLTSNTWTDDEPKWANVPVGASPVPPSTGGTTGTGPTGTGSGPTVVLGGSGLRLSLRVPSQKLGKKRKTLFVFATCNKRCTIYGSASTRARSGKKVKTFRFFRAKKTVNANKRVKLVLRFPKKTLSATRSAIRHHRKLVVTFNVTARTAAGEFTPAAVRKLRIRH